MRISRAGLGIAVVLSVWAVAGCSRGSKGPDVQALVSDLRSPKESVRGAAGVKLIEVGEPAAPAVAELLKDPDPHMRHVGATTLWSMGVKARPAVGPLAEALSDESGEVRVAAGMALQGLGPAGEPAVPALRKALKDKDGAVAREAAKALGNIGPAAAAAIPDLKYAARSDYLRAVADEAILRIQAPR